VTPDLRWAVGQLPPADQGWAPAPGEWSAHETAAHTRDTEREVYLLRVRRVLREERPELAWFDEVGWHASHYRPDEPIEHILSEYEAAHGELVALLRGIDSAAWERSGLHPTAGAQTTAYWARHCYNHALDHVHQIIKVAEAYDQRRAAEQAERTESS
jgi:hypothetical protein